MNKKLLINISTKNITIILLMRNFILLRLIIYLIYGDWGLGIGDWAIPNPQSPIPR